ncbi:hypothetical protein [Dankookia sp. P2]|uniref:hypothetical protein n=1 Tax=Dankookia sp. P2 TaxID=3423955 RepID=UPI003D665A02
MERVLLVVEGSGERISCLLNPETLVFRRRAGLRTRGDAAGGITGFALSDDPVLATGGGRTEVVLDLLFDVALAQELSPVPEAGPALADVRELTRPLWDLAENAAPVGGPGGPAGVRFIWGRSWNVLAVVTAVAERLERFTPDGMPQRSWLRLRLRRLSRSAQTAAPAAPVTPQFETAARLSGDAEAEPSAVEVPVDADGMPLLDLPQIASSTLGDPAKWRVLADYNQIENPFQLEEGTVLRVPPPGERAAP